METEKNFPPYIPQPYRIKPNTQNDAWIAPGSWSVLACNTLLLPGETRNNKLKILRDKQSWSIRCGSGSDNLDWREFIDYLRKAIRCSDGEGTTIVWIDGDCPKTQNTTLVYTSLRYQQRDARDVRYCFVTFKFEQD